MSKSFLIVLALIVLIGSYLVTRNAKESYKVLPIDEQNPLQTGGSDLQKWREFTNAEGKFKVLLPILPQHVTDKINDPVTQEPRKFDMFAAADENGTAYVVSMITLPNKIDSKDIEKALRNVVNDMLARNKSNKLKVAKLGVFQGANALDFAFENGDVTVVGKAILRGTTIYILSMVGKTEAYSGKEFDFFVNSFEILGSNK